jgi:hypothetical protein
MNEEKIHFEGNTSKITWENYGSILLNRKNKFSFTRQEIENFKIIISKKQPSLIDRRKVKIIIN